MRISRSVFLLSSLTSLAFSGVEGDRILKKAKKTGAPTPSPTSAPTTLELELSFQKGIFSDVTQTYVPGDETTGVGLKAIVFAKGVIAESSGSAVGSPVTLTLSLEVTSAKDLVTADTIISSLQFCIPTPFIGGCLNFESSSLFPVDPSSGKYPRIIGASSSGTGILFFGNPAFVEFKAGLFSDPIEVVVTFTSPEPEVVDVLSRNIRLAANIPGFCPPEAFDGFDLPYDNCIDFIANLDNQGEGRMARNVNVFQWF